MSGASRAMAQRAKHAKPAKGRVPLVSISESIIPLFRRRPPWWARNPGTAGLILADLVMTGAFIELTWNHWTEGTVIPTPKDAPANTESTIEWNLRPTWQRFGLCATHLVAGCFFAGGLLGVKARFIRSVSIVPAKATAAAVTKSPSFKIPPTELRTLIIQNASHPKNTGYEFPLRTSWLEEGRDKTELLLRSKETNSRWYLELKDAFINGKKYSSIDEARSLLLNEWKAASLPAHKPRA